MSEDDGLKAMGQVIQIDEARIRDHLGEMVRGTVEETLNALLDAEADRLCGAGRYERTQGRQDTRAGSYERSLHTVAGEVNLKVPKLRRQTFKTAIIERYRRRESSVEEALIEMYLAGISVRRVVGSDLLPVDVRKAIIGQGLVDGLLDEVGCLGHLAGPQIVDDCLGLLVGGLAALLGMNGLEHVADLADPGRRDVAEDVAVEMHHAALVASLRQEIRDALDKAPAGVGND